MRVLVDLRSHLIANPLITQVEKVPAPGTPTPINGKYVLPIIPGLCPAFGDDRIDLLVTTDLLGDVRDQLVRVAPVTGRT